MKHTFFLMIVSLGLAACSHNPPKPYGNFFPINESAPVHVNVQQNPLMKMNNQPLELKHE